MSEEQKRINVRIEGTVQGVGFRPFIFRLAHEEELTGWVLNDSKGVELEVQGKMPVIERFLSRVRAELPPLARICHMDWSPVAVEEQLGFFIRESRTCNTTMAQVPADSFVCEDCLAEMNDPLDRRYRYPFINCTNCGPRYSIVAAVPYDRPLTTMADFPMCSNCQSEYDDPGSRRFHAQPNACADCGPSLGLCDAEGQELRVLDPLACAVESLRRGEVVAIKGLGGYHLSVDPGNAAAVERLRQRKHRDEKPFALMARDLGAVQQFALVGAIEKRLLESAERPIVLLEKKEEQNLICSATAPGNRYLGVMLPYTPLHHLLLAEFPALIMTSGNRSDEPIVFDDAQVVSQLKGIADCFLMHNRRIQIRTDDSISRVLCGEPLLMRRSRGYVPRAVTLPEAQASVLAVGAELKNAVCLTSGGRATLSHHIGDLKNQAVLDSMQQACGHLEKLIGQGPEIIAHDLHPDYASTAAALDLSSRFKKPACAVQHHHAHLASCLADNGYSGSALGVIFDGIGYGADGHIWGGEFLLGDYRGYKRLGHLAEMRMPGGDAATREPWRMAVSLLYSSYGRALPDLDFLEHISEPARNLLLQMVEKGINSPPTSSCGRLFDAVSAMCGLRSEASYEGQAALELEMSIQLEAGATAYPFDLAEVNGMRILDPGPMTLALVGDLQVGRAVGEISAAFHRGLAAGIVQMCECLREETGDLPVALSGGVFQNAFLTELLSDLLTDAGFDVLRHRQVPPNDGGLALGQAVIAAHRLQPQAATP